VQALSQFGTDFTLIAQLFPGRQRKHLKKKFCKEGKHNAARIDEAMKASAHATISSYRDMIRLLRESGMNVGSS
jgi:transcription factor TFIIIB component B''